MDQDNTKVFGHWMKDHTTPLEDVLRKMITDIKALESAAMSDHITIDIFRTAPGEVNSPGFVAYKIKCR